MKKIILTVTTLFMAFNLFANNCKPKQSNFRLSLKYCTFSSTINDGNNTAFYNVFGLDCDDTYQAPVNGIYQDYWSWQPINSSATPNCNEAVTFTRNTPLEKDSFWIPLGDPSDDVFKTINNNTGTTGNTGDNGTKTTIKTEDKTLETVIATAVIMTVTYFIVRKIQRDTKNRRAVVNLVVNHRSAFLNVNYKF